MNLITVAITIAITYLTIYKMLYGWGLRGILLWILVAVAFMFVHSLFSPRLEALIFGGQLQPDEPMTRMPRMRGPPIP